MDPGSVSVGLVVLAGMATFLSPCVLPLVPSYLAVLVGLTAGGAGDDGRGEAPGRRAAAHAALFVLGFSVLFVMAGATGTTAGRWLRGALPLVQQAGGVLLAALGLYLLVGGRRSGLGARGGGAASLAAGVVFSASWTPCIGPVLATALLYAGMPETMGRGMVLLGVFALGLAVPFFAVGVGALALAGAAMGSGRWVGVARRLSGAVVAAVGVLLLTGRFAALTASLARFAPLIEVG